jgi:hypothetical protein
MVILNGHISLFVLKTVLLGNMKIILMQIQIIMIPNVNYAIQDVLNVIYTAQIAVGVLEMKQHSQLIQIQVIFTL